MSSLSYLTAVRDESGSVSGERTNVGANTIARFSAFIMFFCCCSVTLKMMGVLSIKRFVRENSMQFTVMILVQ